MISVSLPELRERGAALIVALNPRSCLCGSDREPKRVVSGSVSWLVCGRCGGRTTARKDGKGGT